jgi:YesN/AraC family two-component response regulator
MSALSILIADDHEVVRRGIRTLFEVRPEWKICGEAATGREAIEKSRKFCPDVVLAQGLIYFAIRHRIIEI